MNGLDRELEGITVVSLEQAVAAPYCGLMLADAGARVIKVERPEGDFARAYDRGADGESAIFAWLNRGKESIALDLKSDADMALMKVMLAKADVFLSNLAPGAVARMRLGGNELRDINKRLITCTITGYGETGEAATRKAYDFLVQGESGVCAVTGLPDDPVRVGVSLTDLSSGLTAFSAILRALIQRGRTGRGVDLSVSMFDVMADWMNMPLLMHRYSGGAPKRSGLQHSFVAPYGAFTCAAGEQILLSIQNNREFRTFCDDVLGRSELADDLAYRDNTDRHNNRDALNGIINEVFGKLSSDQVIAKLDGARIANGRLNDVAAVSDHPFLRNALAQIGGMDVSVAALPVPNEGESPMKVPALNEHGAKLRSEFG